MVEISFNVVVLPLPFGPSRTSTLPEGISSETRFKARVSPLRSCPNQLNSAGRWRKILLTDWSVTAGME